MARSLAELIILLVVSLVLATILNLINPEGIPLFGQWNPDEGLVHAGEICIASLHPVDDLEALDAYLQSNAVFVDARLPAEYDAGHIPGAFNLPIGEIDEAIHNFLDMFPVDTRLILYCSGPECYDASDLMVILQEYDYQDTSVFYQGLIGWKKAGRPIEVTEVDADEQRQDS